MAVIDPGRHLDDVHWELRKRFLKLAKQLERHGWDLKVRSGRRSCSYQNRLYAQGRSEPGQKVTYAPGCRSWHVVGRAVDADPVDRRTGRHIGCSAYQTAAAIWEGWGGKWGGRFQGFGPCGDAGHFEWHPGLDMSEVCPVPADCNDALYLVDTVEPARIWPWMLAGFAGMAAVIVIRGARK